MTEDLDALGLHLANIGRYKLLTREQELHYAGIVRAYQKDPIDDPKAKHQYKRAVDKLICHNLRLVVSVAKKYSKGDPDKLQEYIQEGSIGLRRAIEKFDPDKGFKLSTYAYWWIKQAITRHIKNHDRAIRLPIHIAEGLYRLRCLSAYYYIEHNQYPDEEWLAAKMDKPIEYIRSLIDRSRQLISLDARMPDGEDSYIDFVADDETRSPEAYVQEGFIQREIDELLSILTTRERQVVTLRFGLDQGNARSLAEVGRLLNLSRERVRQIDRQALDKLRKRQRRKSWNFY